MKKNIPEKQIINYNRTAKSDFEIFDTYEAGIALKGSEIKSVRDKNISIKEGFIKIENGEAFLYGVRISPYEAAGKVSQEDSVRKRKLLLHKREIFLLYGKVQRRGFTIIPLSIYLKRGRTKLEIALVKPIKKYDKREDIIKKEHEREMLRAAKRKNVKTT